MRYTPDVIENSKYRTWPVRRKLTLQLRPILNETSK